MSSIESLFEIPALLETDLKSNEEESQKVYDEISGEIEKLAQLEDDKIHTQIVEVIGAEHLLLYENLIYLKQLYFINKKGSEVPEVRTIDPTYLKEIKLIDLLGGTQDLELKEDLKIEMVEVLKQIDVIKEELEQWNEYNVKSTLSQKLEIPEENIEVISTLGQYVEFVSRLSVASDYVSRGQKDCTYLLDPSLHRIHFDEYSIHLSAYERAYKQKVLFYDKEIANKTSVAIIAEGQHFGLPTEFLDFTEAHLISLLFAIENYEYDKQHSIVYFVNSIEFNNEAISQAEKLIDYALPSEVQSLKDKGHENTSHFIKLGNSNERIHFQKGCFLKVGTDKSKMFERLRKYSKIVVINKKFKKEILIELFNLGITFENIYPDKDNVVKSIKFQYKEINGGRR